MRPRVIVMEDHIVPIDNAGGFRDQCKLQSDDLKSVEGRLAFMVQLAGRK